MGLRKDDDGSDENELNQGSEVGSSRSRLTRFLRWLYKSNWLGMSHSADSDQISSGLSDPQHPGDVQLGGGASIAIRALHLFILPLRKIVEYVNWRYDKGKFKKPRWTLTDTVFFGLDVTMLALTIAAVVITAPVTAAAIAFAASVISLAVATYQLAKFVYENKKAKKNLAEIYSLQEILTDEASSQVDIKAANDRAEVLIKSYNPHLTDHYLQEKTSLTVMQHLDKLALKIKESVTDRYRKIQQAIGFTLTMMTVVSASLILAGLMLGPVGGPVVMAGVGLAITVGVITAGMFIVSSVKSYLASRDSKKLMENEGIELSELKPNQPQHKLSNNIKIESTQSPQKMMASASDMSSSATAGSAAPLVSTDQIGASVGSGVTDNSINVSKTSIFTLENKSPSPERRPAKNHKKV